MNRQEQLSFTELFEEAKTKKYKSLEEISIRRKEILSSLNTAQGFDSIKLNCELLALMYLEQSF